MQYETGLSIVAALRQVLQAEAAELAPLTAVPSDARVAPVTALRAAAPPSPPPHAHAASA